jgi:hypothetical protein
MALSTRRHAHVTGHMGVSNMSLRKRLFPDDSPSANQSLIFLIFDFQIHPGLRVFKVCPKSQQRYMPVRRFLFLIDEHDSLREKEVA